MGVLWVGGWGRWRFGTTSSGATEIVICYRLQSRRSCAGRMCVVTHAGRRWNSCYTILTCTLHF